MTISLVVAASTNLVIGVNNDLPWRLPADLKHFKAITTGHHILMGRKTWESLGRPLPDRTSLVISGKKRDLPEEVFGFTGIEEAVSFAESRGEAELMVIGGGEMYAQFLALADKIYFTHVYTQIKNGTAFFPPVLQKEWEIKESVFYQKDEKNPFSMEFITLARTKNKIP